jgi:hypothetical protein
MSVIERPAAGKGTFPPGSPATVQKNQDRELEKRRHHP